MNLLSAAERLAALDRSTVKLEPDRCLHSMDRLSECEACSTLCPDGAIQAGEPPVLLEEKCTRCLACLPACPSGAFHADDSVAALLNCAARVEGTGPDHKAIELVCERHPEAGTGLPASDIAIRVRGCLAGLGAGAYLTLVAMGVQQVVVRIDACAQCPWSQLKGLIETEIDHAKRLLDPFGKSDDLALLTEAGQCTEADRPLWDAQNPPLSRRDLFRLATRQGQIAAARVLSEGEEGGGQRPPRERQRILAALAHLPSWTQALEVSLAGMGFGTVSVTGECTACGACARICPTGALQYEQVEAVSFELKLSPQSCIGCEACSHVCAPGAITVDREPGFEAIFGQEGSTRLRSGELVRCQRCGAAFAARPGTRLCPVCEFRLKNPFGTLMPPGMKMGDRSKGPNLTS